MDISCIAFKGQGVDLEVEGVRYIDASWAAYVLDLPPSRGGDLELEGVRYIHASWAAYVLDLPPSRGGDLELAGGVNAQRPHLLATCIDHTTSQIFNLSFLLHF